MSKAKKTVDVLHNDFPVEYCVNGDYKTLAPGYRMNTGLTDCEGKALYQHDIIESKSDYAELRLTGVVVWHQRWAQWAVYWFDAPEYFHDRRSPLYATTGRSKAISYNSEKAAEYRKRYDEIVYAERAK